MTTAGSSEREYFPYDKSSKWLIQHHGDAILRLAGIDSVASWRAVAAELVQARQLPDGLLEVRLEGESALDLFVLELATYPERRVTEQVLRDAMLVYLDRQVWPEVLVVVLCPKGKLRVDSQGAVQSRRGWSISQTTWRVVELWTLPASDLLATRHAGLMPWVPLTKIEGPPELAFKECRTIIDTKSPPEDHENLLAVTQILGSLRYDKAMLKSLFGGNYPMIDTPLLREIVAEAEAKGEAKAKAIAKQEDIASFLEARFGPLPEDLVVALRNIVDLHRLEDLIRQTARCKDLAAFQKHLK